MGAVVLGRAVTVAKVAKTTPDPMRWLFLLGVAVALPLTAWTSDKVYKSVGPDGRIVYSQTPPEQSQGRVEKQLEFRHLPATALLDYVLKFRAEMERNMASKTQGDAAPPAAGLRLFMAKWCGYCRQAQAWLGANGVAYQALDIDTPEGMTAFVRTGNKVAVPLLVGPGVKLQGFKASAYAAALQKPEPKTTP